MGNLTLVILAGLCLALVIAAPTDPKLCSTPACKAAAANFADYINSTADPCNNFYAYACGNWKQRHPIKESKFMSGTFSDLVDKITAQIRTLLDKFSQNTDSKHPTNSVAYGVHIYQRCLALGKESSEVGLANLKAVAKAILGHDWTIGQSETPSPVLYSWAGDFGKTFAAGVSSVFSMEELSQLSNVTKNMITIGSAQFAVDEKTLQNLTSNPKLISAYKDYIRKTARRFCGGKCENSLLEKDIDDIVNLESELAKNKLPVEKQADPQSINHVLTFKQIHDKTKYDFANTVLVPLFKSLGLPTSSAPLSQSDQIQLLDENYVLGAIDILNRTPARTLANYMGWRIVMSIGPKSSEEFRLLYFKYIQAVSGMTKAVERAETCQNLVNSQVNMALSRLFVDHHFSEHDKHEVTVLVNSIQDSLRTMLQENNWLDSETKAASISKLNHIQKRVGYPSWLLKNDKLDESYDLQDKTVTQALLTEKNYLLAVVQFARRQAKRWLGNINKPIDRETNWPTFIPPAIVSAAYFPFQNAITIAAAFMKFPFFAADQPFALNYGSSGYVIAHEFTHSMDNNGRQYDEVGNIHNWWTEEALKRFNNQSECFVKQYGAQVETTSGLHLNGRHTLSENLADNGGLRGSFHAFQARQVKSGRSPRLADLPKYSSEQLFFLSFANTWCMEMTPELMKWSIIYDAHSPSEQRINMPLANSPDFAKAFNCPVGSKMNPAKKCQVW